MYSIMSCSDHPLVKLKPMRMFLSTCGILYVWSLPLLAMIGFAEPGSHSISEFIANPPATGAMAAISMMPLTLMWEYQDVIIMHYKNGIGKKPMYYSLTAFQIFYGMFLICTYGYVPNWLHTTTVVVFGTSFITHSALVIKYVQTNKYSTTVLCVGIMSFASLLFVKGMWFWAMECLGLSSMILFTPLDWVFLIKQEKNRMEELEKSLPVNVSSTENL